MDKHWRLPRLALAYAVVLISSAVSAEGVGFQAFEEAFNGVSPAAPFLAVGPGHIVAVSNNGIRFFTKDGTMTYDNTFSGTGGFFPGGGSPHNPRVVFDPHTNLFIVAGYYRYGVHDFITVAISDDEDPNGEWHRHTFGVDAVGSIPLFDGDRTTLGVDATAIYVYNDFYFLNRPSDPFSHGFVFSIDKLTLANGGTPAVVPVEPFEDPLAIVPAVTYDVNSPAQYLVTPFGTYGFDDTIRLFALRDALGTPVVDTLELEVPAYDFISASDRMPHPGGGVTLSATDTRMRHAVYRDGSLWTAHHVRDPATGRHLARWYEIGMHGWPVSGELPELLQAGKIDLGIDYHTFLPDIAPDGAGNAAITFNHTSATSPPALARAVRLSGDRAGTVRFIQTLRKTEVLLGSPTVYAASSAADVDVADRTRGWVGGVYWITNQWGGRQPAMWVNSVSLVMCGSACRAVSRVPRDHDAPGDGIPRRAAGDDAGGRPDRTGASRAAPDPTATTFSAAGVRDPARADPRLRRLHTPPRRLGPAVRADVAQGALEEAGDRAGAASTPQSAARPASEPRLPRDYASAIARARGEAGEAEALVAEIAAIDAQIERLTADADPEEPARLREKLDALGTEATQDGEERRQRRRLLQEQLDLIGKVEARLEEARARRQSRFDALRELWRSATPLLAPRPPLEPPARWESKRVSERRVVRQSSRALAGGPRAPTFGPSRAQCTFVRPRPQGGLPVVPTPSHAQTPPHRGPPHAVAPRLRYRGTGASRGMEGEAIL